MKCLVLVLTCSVLLARARDFDITAKEITDADIDNIEDELLEETDPPVIDGTVGDEQDTRTFLNGREADPFELQEDAATEEPFIDGVQGDEPYEIAEDQALYGWTKYSFSWCTVQGRDNNNPLHKQVGVQITFQQCKNLCNGQPGCTAVEYWGAYNWACFVCTDTSRITPYTNTKDLAYPVHVWVQNPGPPPTTNPPVTTTQPPPPPDTTTQPPPPPVTTTQPPPPPVTTTQPPPPPVTTTQPPPPPDTTTQPPPPPPRTTRPPPPITRPPAPVTTVNPHPVSHPIHKVNLTCGQDEMWISIPKYLLHGLDAEHLRLNDVRCGAKETETDFVFHTATVGASACGTTIRVTKGANGFVCYMNNVLEIPLVHHQIITRVREVEVPFACYYSKWGVVSSVGLDVKSKKIVFSKKAFGKFILNLLVSPDKSYHSYYKKHEFPVSIPLRTEIYASVSVDTEDDRLEIIAEDCFATPYPDPFKDVGKWQYFLIKDGCAVDSTVKYLPTNEPNEKHFTFEAFNFIGDHQFVYLHCKVKVCNRTDPHSRCKQGCIPHPIHRRSLEVAESKDEEYHLAQGPFMRRDVEEQDTDMKDTDGVRDVESRGQYTLIAAMAVMAAVGLVGVSYFVWDRKKQSAYRKYQHLTVHAED